MEILLNKNKSKRSNAVANDITLDFTAKRRLLSEHNMTEALNVTELYDMERSKTTKYRLALELNVVCTNILSNIATEIVKDEGSSDPRWLHLTPGPIENVVGCNPNKDWTATDGVMDTQLSSSGVGFTYHCGYDIFDNHILRNTSFKSVNLPEVPLDEFNTIADIARFSNNKTIKRYPEKGDRESMSDPSIDMHLYSSDEIMSFEDSWVSNRVIQNGWVGFINRANFPSYDKKEICHFNKVINTNEGCDFIDLYPDRSLYSFIPKYNQYKHRMEKNWIYYLTYPSSSTTENVSIINEQTKGLKISHFTEMQLVTNGNTLATFYCYAAHGLQSGDELNIYKTYTNASGIVSELCISNAVVSEVKDSFTFSAKIGTQHISDQWLLVDDNLQLPQADYFRIDALGNKIPITFTEDRKNIIDNTEVSYYKFPIRNGYANIDETTQDLSFKKVEEDVECDYYVRIFSRLPNFKFAKEKISEKTLYSPNSTLIADNEMVDFQNTISKMGFATNAYGDGLAELVYLDDIDINGLRDNLGRPLTTIYLTCLKNNAGYKQWYGKDGQEPDLGSDDVEYSHCFGKLNCGYEVPENIQNNIVLPNIHKLNNLGGTGGLNVSLINSDTYRDTTDSDDEINPQKNHNFYGDLCVFSPVNYKETVLQPIYYRFNTAQRELVGRDYMYAAINSNSKYHEITSNDWEDEGFQVEEYPIQNIQNKEGYYYQPHKEIPLRTFSESLYVRYPIICTPKYIIIQEDETEYLLKTVENNYFEEGNNFKLYNLQNNKSYLCHLTEIIDYKTCKFTLVSDEMLEDFDKPYLYRAIVFDETVPTCAHLANDGSMRCYWREIVPNGLNRDIEEEAYPFTNGALYINKKLNLFVKRQDPYGNYGLWNNFSIEGARPINQMQNNYIPERQLEC